MARLRYDFCFVLHAKERCRGKTQCSLDIQICISTVGDEMESKNCRLSSFFVVFVIKWRSRLREKARVDKNE